MAPKSVEVFQERLKIPFTGKIDANGNDYYFTTTHIPMGLDLSSAVIHLFPWEKEDGEFGIDMVFRKYDPNHKGQQSEVATGKRRTRPSKGADEDPKEEVSDD